MDGKYLFSGSMHNTVRQWSVESGEVVRTLQGHTGWVRSVAVSADGKYLFSGSHDGTMRQWSVESGELIETRGDDNATSTVEAMRSASSPARSMFRRAGRTVEQIEKGNRSHQSDNHSLH